MHEKERQREIQLVILLVCTIMIFVLSGESILLGWDKAAIVLLALGIAAGWYVYFTEKIPESVRLWMYFILTMLSFFFYGIHETSIYDLAPVMILVIIMYSATEKYNMIRLCVATYFLTMTYDFVFVLGLSTEFSLLDITRILLHLLLVYMAGYMTKIGIKRRSKERKRTDDKMAQLEETNHRTEDFLTNVSHELRTPINAVSGITSVMLKNEENAEKRKDLLAIQTAGRRLFGQIGDILDYTEIDTGKIKVSEETYMISSLINDIIAGERLLERENTLELIFDIDAGIPSVLLGDEKKIKKVIEHLIDNAYKFTKEGGIYVRVSALHKDYGINLCIRVSDTGSGIVEDELEKIKERFVQSDAGRNRRAGGLGLGLPIVYGLVSAMEGFIQMESTPGQGTTVFVSIPQKVVDEASCMTIANREALCLACYIKPELYEIPEVRNYYYETITNMVQELDISLHRVSNMDELKKLVSMYQLTHLCLGSKEYEENPSYFEELAQNIRVYVVAEADFIFPEGSRVRILEKPFHSLPIVHILNSDAEDTEVLKKKSMICPDIRVLVVDDEPMNLMVAEGIFKNYQMNVTTAESGGKAIELCESKEFDLIFLDHMMPEMDGVETLKRLRKIYADTDQMPVVIAFTANAVSGAREMFLREGFDEFVSKPIEPLELERILRKMLPKSAISYVDENNIVIPEKKEKGNSIEDKIRELESGEIHTDSGIQYCSGDLNFYVELLTTFAKEAVRKESMISDLFRQENWKDYEIQVHAVKSTAKMVGADSLSEKARQLEMAAKNNDNCYIRENHEAFFKQYHQVVQRISEILEMDSDQSERETEGEEISKETLLLCLTDLKEGLDTFEADKSESLLVEMGTMVYDGISVKELLSAVGQDVENFEFSKASDKVAELIENVEGGETL